MSGRGRVSLLRSNYRPRPRIAWRRIPTDQMIDEGPYSPAGDCGSRCNRSVLTSQPRIGLPPCTAFSPFGVLVTVILPSLTVSRPAGAELGYAGLYEVFLHLATERGQR